MFKFRWRELTDIQHEEGETRNTVLVRGAMRPTLCVLEVCDDNGNWTPVEIERG